jgi:hypothetical protein
MKKAKQQEYLPAKMCFSHIGGKLGSMLMESFLDNGWIEKSNAAHKHFFITDKGKKEFLKLGVDVTQIEPENELH